MATRKIKILAGSGLLLAVAGGTWLAMNLFAAQAQGTLSQHPMNLKVSAPPSFIMAVDDSFDDLPDPVPGAGWYGVLELCAAELLQIQGCTEHR